MSEVTKEKIIEALSQLDHTNDDHWTKDGAPKMEAVELLLGDIDGVSRADVTDAHPEFNRKYAENQASEDNDESEVDSEDTVEEEDLNSPEDESEEDESEEDESEEDESEEDESEEDESEKTQDEMDLDKSNAIFAEVAEMDKEINDEMLEISKAKSELDKKIAKRDALEREANALKPESSSQLEISRHLSQQQKNREFRAASMIARQKLLAESGLLDVPKKSAIDSAMERNTKRGQNRPQA